MDEDSRVDVTDEILRSCARCGTLKPQREFHRSRTGQFSYCTECRRAYDRTYYAERGRDARLARMRIWRDEACAWMDEFKAGRACADCGGIFPTCVMHWDHLPGHLKIDAISAMVANRRRELVLEEVKKCELVCANCHVMRTVARARRTIAEDAGVYRFDCLAV